MRRLDEDGDVFRAVSRSAPPVGIIATAVSIGSICIAFALAPQIEGFLFPVFSGNVILPSSVTRDGDRLCWTRIGLKVRDLPLIDIDADVDYISNVTHRLAHQPTPEIFDAESGEPITTDDAVPAGVPFELRRCVKLSSHILPGQPVRLRQVAYYQSPTGLYNVPVTVPTIVLPADQAGVFAQHHDSAPSPKDVTKAVAGPPPEPISARSAKPRDLVRSPDDYLRHQAEVDAERRSIRPVRRDAIPLGDMLRNDDAGEGRVRVETTISPRDAERLEQSRVAHGDKSRAATLRRLIPQGLDGEDRDALGVYDPAVK